MIILSGSSWCAGEWEGTRVTHPGLTQYIADDGKLVINLSQPGTSSREFYEVLHNFVKFNKSLNIEKIIVFENNCIQYYTDLLKHDEIAANFFTDQLSKGIDHFILALSSKFYHQLSVLGQQYNIPIVLVGSYSDTIWSDDFSVKYPMLSIGCQSTVNLLLTQNPRINVPVRVVTLSSKYIPALELINKHLSIAEREKFLEYITLGQQRDIDFYQNPNYFCPDGKHLNRHAHKILFDHLKKNSIL